MSSEGWLPWCLLFVLVSILIICGNVLTILVMTRARPLQSNLRFLIINLAVADVTVGLLTVPLYVYHIVVLNYGPELVIYRMLDVFTAFASIFSLVAVAAERFAAIYWPLKYECAKPQTYSFVIAVVWLLAASLGLLMAFRTLGKIPTNAFYVPMMLCFFVSLGILPLCYSAIWFVAKRNQVDESRGFEKQLAATLIVVTVLFVVMWLPFQVLNILHYYRIQCGAHCYPHLIYSFKLLHYGNSFVNPIIYAFRIPGFKRAALTSFCCSSPGSRAHDDGVTMETIEGIESPAVHT